MAGRGRIGVLVVGAALAGMLAGVAPVGAGGDDSTSADDGSQPEQG